MERKGKGFTLVELLAVIVILAIILVIAVPQILKTIDSSRLGAITSTAKLLVNQAEKQYMVDQTLNAESSGDLDEVSYSTIGTGEEGTCSYLTELSINDYDTCSITVDEEGNATLNSLVGKGKFKGYSCSGTKDNICCTKQGEDPVCTGSGSSNNEEVVFTNFTGKVLDADEYFFDLESLPENASFWIQTNGTVAEGCVHDFNTNVDICLDASGYDCGTPSLDQNDKLVCSQEGYASQKISEIQAMGFECRISNSNRFYCLTANSTRDSVGIDADGNLTVSDIDGWRCDVFAEEGIDCN